MEISEVLQFYKDTKIFITGGTGFVGKTLIEKLLRVTEVATIYMLIREKKGKTSEERLDKMFENPLFDVLKSKKPNYRSKIKAVIGECGTEGLTISDLDNEELRANIQIIFHSAATVNFNENIKTAYETNVKGTKSVLDLAKEMHKLKAMVYVSTAYSNCDHDKIIEEKVYDYKFKDIIDKIDITPKEDIESEKIIGKWPNTYVLTKAMAESLIRKEGKDLPIGIFRPSIIAATYKEPIPGWLDNFYALNGIVIGIQTGFLRVILSRDDIIIDVIPVDKCVSALAVTSWDIAEKKKTEKNEDIPVYNFISGNENPVTNGILGNLNFAHGTPSSQAIWYPCSLFVTNKILFWFLSIVLEIIPAIFLDALAVVTGGKPRLVALYKRVLNLMVLVNFFGLSEFRWDNQNIQNLWKKINKADQEIFPFSMESISWLQFCRTYALGTRRYVLKEDDATIPQAFTKYYRFKVAHYILKAVAIYLIYYIVTIFLCKVYNTIMA